MKLRHLLLTGAALTSFAATTVHGETVVNGAKLTVTKNLDLVNSNALIPNTDFTFKIEPDTTVNEDGNKFKGVALNTPMTKVTYTNSDKGGSNTKTAEFDFSEVTFEKPGVYYYKVTEEKIDKVPGVSYDTTSYTVQVHVLWNEEQQKPVATYIVGYKEGSKVPIQFKNSLDSTTLTVKKKVSGTGGDRSKDFNFGLTLKANQYYKASEKVMIEKTTKGGQAPVQTEASIDQLYHFTLQDGESIKVTNLPVGVDYVVTEDDYKSEKYTTNVEVSPQDGAVKNIAGNSTEQETSTDKDMTITFTNKKDFEVPTGVAMTVAPYIALGIVAVGGALYFVKKKNA
ncbi:TPA: FCT-2 pilus major pilin FctA/T1 [Streptococcus pyogenes]